MAERKPRRQTKQQSEQSELEQARQKSEQLEAESKALGALDDPKEPEQGSPWLQTAYLSAVVIFGFVLNLIVIIAVSGGK